MYANSYQIYGFYFKIPIYVSMYVNIYIFVLVLEVLFWSPIGTLQKLYNNTKKSVAGV